MFLHKEERGQYDPLLDDADTNESVASLPSSCKHVRIDWRWFTLLHVFFLLAYIVTSAWLYSSWRGLITADSMNTLDLATTSVVFEVNPRLEESRAWRFTGPPSDELDKNWNELLHNTNIAVPEADMILLERLDEGVRLGDGSGYLGQLAVFHSLHCVKRIHHFLHRDHYFANLTENELRMLEAHNVHCLDLIRQSLMCQPDMSLITMRWGDMQPVPLANSSSPHQCVSWDALNGWAHQRSVDVFKPNMVVHPKFGPSYAGDGKELGVVIDH